MNFEDGDGNLNKKDIIKRYFHANFLYPEIFYFLEKFHSWEISLHQLHRLLRSFNLSQRVNKSSRNSVTDFATERLCRLSFSIGYRYLHVKAKLAAFIVDWETIRLNLRSLDPEGVEMRL